MGVISYPNEQALTALFEDLLNHFLHFNLPVLHFYLITFPN